MDESQYEFCLDVCGFMGSDEQMRPRMFRAREVLAALDPAVPYQRAHRLYVEEVLRRGGRYSGETGDVCASAWRARGKAEPSQWDAAWMAAVLARAEAKEAA